MNLDLRDYELNPITGALHIAVRRLNAPIFFSVNAKRWDGNGGFCWIGIESELLSPASEMNADAWEGDFKRHVDHDRVFYWATKDTTELIKCRIVTLFISDGSNYAHKLTDGVAEVVKPMQELCPTCGPNRGTMLYLSESSCWRCGWRRV